MGFIVKAVKSVVKAVVGVVSKVVGGIFGFAVGGSKSKTAKPVNTLNKSLDPETYRKIVFGRTAASCDVRFWQVWGSKGEKFDEVIVVATHRIHSFQETYFEDKKAFDAVTSTINAPYIGVCSREYTLGQPGQGALNVGGGSQYDNASTFDGCAAMVLKWIPDDKKLPNGVPSRYTQIIEGALVYDPRRDSTQPGGSGPHRADDRTTWAYATLDGNGVPIGRNNALQALWYLLGWTIPTKDAGGNVTGEMLVAGRGVDPQDINMATFIAGANACEAAGYYTDIVLSTGDNHTSNEDKITCNGLIGRLIDPGGLWSYYANVDDTANIALELTDDDIAAGTNFQWEEFKGMSDQFNQVGGKFVNPSAITLFQPFPYPLVRDATYENNLGTKRRKTIDFEQVLDGTLAQRLARLFLNQGQFQGELSAGFLPRAIKAQAWSVVRYTSERWGWSKLFRVWRHDLNTDGAVGMLLKEIHPSIWGAGTVVDTMVPGYGSGFNPLQEIAATGVVVTLVPMAGANGTLADGFRVSWDAPGQMVRRTEVRYKLAGTATWASAGPIERDVTSVLVGPLLSGAIYEVQVRHISIMEVPGPWVFPTAAPANGAGQFQLGTTGNVNYAAIAAAGGTAVWANITGAGKPANFADVTGSNFSAGVTGAGPFLYDQRSPNALFGGKANLLKNGGFKLQFQNWNKFNWNWAQGTTHEGPFVFCGTPGTQILYSEVFSIYGNANYTLQAELAQNGMTAGSYVGADVEFFNESMGSIGTSASIFVLPGSSWDRKLTNITAPANAWYARIRIYSVNNNAGASGYARRIKLSGEHIDVPFTDELTDGAWLDNTFGRIRNPTAYNTQAILGPRNVSNISPSYSVGGSNVTVNIPAHNRVIAGVSGPVTLSYGAGSGVWPFSSYWAAYIDDPELTGFGSPAYVLTSNPNDLLYPGRYQVASGVTPASGGTGGSTGGGGGGTGGGIENCVEASSLMPDGKFAMEVEAGDLIEVLDESTWQSATLATVTSNKLAEANCVELTSFSGIKLVLSETTPCTLEGGVTVLAKDVLDHSLAVRDSDGFRWEQIVSVRPVGNRAVAHISCNNGTYAAGLKPDRFIYTHNPYQKP